MAEISGAHGLGAHQVDRLLRAGFRTSYGTSNGYRLGPSEPMHGYAARVVDGPRNSCVALVYLGGGYLMQVFGRTADVRRFTDRYLTTLVNTG